MSNTPAMSLDAFLANTLRTFMEGQVTMYYASIHRDGNANVDNVQARYEAYCVAFSTLCKAFTGTEPLEDLPEPWKNVMTAIHDQILKDGDDYLRSIGIDPEDM